MQHHEAHVPTLHAALTLERPVSSRRPPPTRQRQAGPQTLGNCVRLQARQALHRLFIVSDHSADMPRGHSRGHRGDGRREDRWAQQPPQAGSGSDDGGSETEQEEPFPIKLAM